MSVKAEPDVTDIVDKVVSKLGESTDKASMLLGQKVHLLNQRQLPCSDVAQFEI
jgi:hypothetical protein